MTGIVDETERQARYDTFRPRLLTVATRLLGSPTEAEDAVQEAWLRLHRTTHHASDHPSDHLSDQTGESGGASIDNLEGWLTTVVSRVCLDVLRSRRTRREEPLEHDHHDQGPGDPALDPAEQAAFADQVGAGVVLLLDRLSPGERIAFVLHDLFGVAFDEIAPVLGRSAGATRQLASRGRRRLRGADPDTRVSAGSEAERRRQHEVVTAFLTATRSGDLAGLLQVLHPDAVLAADAQAAARGAQTREGADAIATFFAGGAKSALPAEIRGRSGLAWALRGEVQVAFDFTVVDGRITAIDLRADPQVLADVVLSRKSTAAG